MVQWKLTQHCKAIFLQLKKIKKISAGQSKPTWGSVPRAPKSRPLSERWSGSESGLARVLWPELSARHPFSAPLRGQEEASEEGAESEGLGPTPLGGSCSLPPAQLQACLPPSHSDSARARGQSSRVVKSRQSAQGRCSCA